MAIQVCANKSCWPSNVYTRKPDSAFVLFMRSFWRSVFDSPAATSIYRYRHGPIHFFRSFRRLVRFDFWPSFAKLKLTRVFDFVVLLSLFFLNYFCSFVNSASVSTLEKSFIHFNASNIVCAKTQRPPRQVRHKSSNLGERQLYSLRPQRTNQELGIFVEHCHLIPSKDQVGIFILNYSEFAFFESFQLISTNFIQGF